MCECVSVKDFGAVGDGITSDSVAFNAAIAAVAPVMGCVCVPSGAYLIDTSIILEAGVTLIGEGRNSVLLQADNSPVNTPTISVRDGSRVENLTLDGNAANQVNLLWAIRAYQRSKVVCRNVLVRNGRGIGIGWSDSEDCECIDCEATGMTMIRSGFWAEGGNGRHRYINCKSHHNQGDGLVLKAPNCYVEGGDYSVNGYGAPSYGLALGAAGIFTEGGVVVDGITIIGIRAADNSEFGIAVGAVNCIIQGCTLTGNQLSGLLMKNGSRYTVASNICVNNGWYTGNLNPAVWVRAGIAMLPPVSHTTLVGNLCYDSRSGGSKTQEHGILFSSAASPSNSTHISLVGNVTEGNKIANDNLNPSVAANVFPNLTVLDYRDFKRQENPRRNSTTATQPSVAGLRLLYVAGPVTITHLTDAEQSQIVSIICTGGAVTIKHGEAGINGIRTVDSNNVVLNTYGQSITLVRMPNSLIYELSRSVT